MKAEYLERYRKLFPSQISPSRNRPMTASGFINFDGENTPTLDEYLHAITETIHEMKTDSSPLLGGSVKQPTCKKLLETAVIPEQGILLSKIFKRFEELAEGHPTALKPTYMTNAIPIPTKISIAAMTFGAILNSNPVWRLYGPAASDAEEEVLMMMSEWMRYDKTKVGGYFTYGGTGGNEGALRIGLEKAAPGYRQEGIPSNVYVLSNELAHFSVDSVVADSMGTKKNIRVKSNLDNSINLQNLEERMEEILKPVNSGGKGGEIAVIYATGGTTDGFGMDEISKIKEIRDRLAKKYGKSYLPHIHADLAMGGFFAAFNDYDFENNPLGIEETALISLKKIQERMLQIKDADSAIFDFHKLGYTPYLNSLFIIKDAQNFKGVTRDDNASPYIGDRKYGGGRHTGETKECSRIFASLAAYANLEALGKDGYRTILGNLIERAEQLKSLIHNKEGIEVLNDKLPGPTVLFRFYDSSITHQNELDGKITEAKIQEKNELMELGMGVFEKNRDKVFFGDTKRYRKVPTRDGKSSPIYAMKAFMISPYTDEKTIDAVAEYILRARGKIEGWYKEKIPINSTAPLLWNTS